MSTTAAAPPSPLATNPLTHRAPPPSPPPPQHHHHHQHHHHPHLPRHHHYDILGPLVEPPRSPLRRPRNDHDHDRNADAPSPYTTPATPAADNANHPATTTATTTSAPHPHPHPHATHSLPRKRRRKAISCLECRRRKKHCDGIVPGCSECRKRGVVDTLCRWGDARDDLHPASNSASPNHLGNPPSSLPLLANAAVRAAAPSPSAQSRSLAAQPSTSAAARTPNASSLSGSLPPSPPLDQDASLATARPSSRPHTAHPAIPPRPQIHTAIDDASQQRQPLDPLPSRRTAPRPSQRASNGYHHEDQLVEALASVDSAAVHTSASQPRASAAAVVASAAPLFPLPSKEVAADLLCLYSRQLDVFFLWPPSQFSSIFKVFHTFYRPDDLASMQQQPDYLALFVSMLCLSIDLAPPTYALTNTSITRIKDRHRLIQGWHAIFLDAIERCDMLHSPTLPAVQALCIFQAHFAAKPFNEESLRLFDVLVRAARAMGIDRLGTHGRDVELWRRQDAAQPRQAQPQQQGRRSVNDGEGRAARHAAVRRPTELRASIHSYHSSVCSWAVETFTSRNVAARNAGRAIWTVILACDWARTRFIGYYLIWPNSFSTGYDYDPRTLQFCRGDEPEQERCDNFGAFVAAVSDIGRRHFDLITEAALTDSEVDYGAILALDDELQRFLDSRPPWLRFEDKKDETIRRIQQQAIADHLDGGTGGVSQGRGRVEVSDKGNDGSGSGSGSGNGATGSPPASMPGKARDTVQIIIIITTIFHRIMALHRPFLVLGYRHPERYGRSVERCLASAKHFVKACMRCSEKGLLFVQLAHIHQRMFQVALVLVTHLLFRSTSSSSSHATPSPPLLSTMSLSASPSTQEPRLDHAASSTEEMHAKIQREELKVHEYIYYCITSLEKLDRNSVRSGRLEQLLAACATIRMRRRQMDEVREERRSRHIDGQNAVGRDSGAQGPGVGSKDPAASQQHGGRGDPIPGSSDHASASSPRRKDGAAAGVPSSSSTGPDSPDQLFDPVLLRQLDASLLKLTEMGTHSSSSTDQLGFGADGSETDLDGVWNDIFSALGCEAPPVSGV